MTKTAYSGILPVVPTTFTNTGDLDLDSQRRALDCIVDQGVDGACILANFSEQFLLTDDERDTLLTVSLDHITGRIPIIVTCSHFSSRARQTRGGCRCGNDHDDAALSRHSIES
jgi:2-keto-3-deoxy-L-arabinonate dehydratase